MFSFTRCLEIVVHNITIDSLSYYSLQTIYISSSNFTSLSFLKLIKELFFSFLFADCCVRLRILGRSLPQGNSLARRSSSLLSTKINFKELTHFSECFPYNVKTFHCTRLVALQSTAKLVSSTAPKRRYSSHTFRYGYLVTT